MALKSPSQSSRGGAALTVAVLALVAACASPSVQSSSAIPMAQSAIAAAVKDGAQQRDPWNLAMAQQKLATAQKWAAEGYYDDSRRAAEEAAIDAQLASARSRAVVASNALSQLQGNTPPERQ